ncbi:unnamed protein product [Brachionus calyciflorus]|uniref:Uncharacterized protein n=1 Tax=Brachionus calyciflorus TaxID=104777 RepID=A0A814GP84_9BILA|nr:unnamed protein product [Brachionus calyciflorus]
MQRGQLDLIDYQSMPDGIYKWIMHYQDHHNKFSYLSPLTSKEANEVAIRLIEIFTLIGAPFGSVERANADIKNMLSLWMKDNKSTNWSLGLKFVQMTKNNSYHRIIKCTPYFATFGKEMNYGVGISSIPKDLLSHISTEEELEQLWKNNIEKNSPEHIQV